MIERDAQGGLRIGGASLAALLEQAACGTPAYVYDLDGMAEALADLVCGFGDAPHLVAYALKANSAGRVVRALAEGSAGADVVSGGELALALACGIAPSRVVFSGVGKRDDELDAALAAGVLAVQAESVEELERIAARARALGRVARVSIRVNPGLEVDTHAHVATGHDEAKFGVAEADLGDAWSALARNASTLALTGLSSHVGSQLVSTDTYARAAEQLARLARSRVEAGAPLSFIDTGGGFGIDYGSGCPARPADFAAAAVAAVRREGLGHLTLVVEPGRSLVAPWGLLVASTIAPKVSRAGRRWLVIDAGMNDLLRPALYQARHRVEPLVGAGDAPRAAWRVVGPVCESSDDFGTHELPAEPPGAVVLRDAGAYGYSMASRYNGRPLPAEVFVRGGQVVGCTPRASADDWVRDRLAT